MVGTANRSTIEALECRKVLAWHYHCQGKSAIYEQQEIILELGCCKLCLQNMDILFNARDIPKIVVE